MQCTCSLANTHIHELCTICPVSGYQSGSTVLVQEPTLPHLREALRTLVSEQQEISLKAACTTSSLNRLNKRLLLFERYLIALSRKGVEPAEKVEGGGEEKEEEEKMDRERVREVEEDIYTYVYIISHLFTERWHV